MVRLKQEPGAARQAEKVRCDDAISTRSSFAIGGEQYYLWRAVDQDGNVLDILVQSRRDKRPAKKFFRQLLKGLAYVPRVVITDKLASYGAARREVLPSVEHRRHKGLNNRAENSHQPTRDGSGGCGGSRVRAMPSGSSPPTGRSPATSARAATASPPTPTVRPAANASQTWHEVTGATAIG